MLAYLNTNNSSFRRISRAARHGPQAHSLLLIYLQLSQVSLSISQLVFEVQGQEWISEGLLGDNMKSQLSHEFLTYKIKKKVTFFSCHFYEKKQNIWFPCTP